MMDLSPNTPKLKFKRVLLKISGEVLKDKVNGESICHAALYRICDSLKAIHALGVQVGLVVGGGNIFRGLSGATSKGVDRTTGDYMGMLATVINGLALMDCLEKLGVPVRVQTAIPMNQVAEPFILRKAIRHLEKGRLVIFVAGSGNPYFSTDTAAALRATEIQADLLLKATKVDGVYDKNPHEHADAKKYTELSFSEALRNRLNVMDATAFALCLDNNIPIMVFDIEAPEAIQKAVFGEPIGTLVR
jgi:uridylate kinase